MNQIEQIEKKIREEISENGPITLNLYGFSRGGAAVFLLCKKLKNISREHLIINASAFEPVPGNFMTGVYVDTLIGANTTLSSRISDLSDCQNIARLQVLFTCKPLPDIACHGPLLPILPKDCHVEVDVTAGCHKSAELFQTKYDIEHFRKISPYNMESAAAFHQVVDFLEQSGVVFDFEKLHLDNSLSDRSIDNKEYILNKLRRPIIDVLEEGRETRSMHYGNEIRTKPLLSEERNHNYLNLYHQRLMGNEKNPMECALVLKEYDPVPKYSNAQKSFGLFKSSVLIGTVAVATAIASSSMAYGNNK